MTHHNSYAKPLARVSEWICTHMRMLQADALKDTLHHSQRSQPCLLPLTCAPLIVLEKPSSPPPAQSSSVVLPPHPLNHPALLSCRPLLLSSPTSSCASAFPFLAVTPHLPSSLGSLYEWHCWASIPLLTVSIRLSVYRHIHARLFSASLSLLSSIPLVPAFSPHPCHRWRCAYVYLNNPGPVLRTSNLPTLSADIFDYITPSPWTLRTLRSNFIR